MRRFIKALAFIGACSAALILTVSHNGNGIRVGADNQLRAATRPAPGKYDLAQLPIFSKTLFYVRENYFDKNRLDPKRMLVGALDFVQRDVPEILIDRWPEHDPKQVTVKVNGQQRSFSIERVDAPWSLRTHAAGDLPLRAAEPAAGAREGRVAAPGRDRDGRHQRHALHARSALGPARRRDLQGHAHPDPGEVRGSRHRHRDGQEEPHHGQASDARHTRDPGRDQGQGPHRPHQQRVDRQHDAERGGRAAARRRRHQRRRLHRSRQRARDEEVHHHARLHPSARHRSAGARAGGAGGPGAAAGQGRLLPHAALLGQQRRRPRRRADDVRAREGQGDHHGPAR